MFYIFTIKNIIKELFQINANTWYKSHIKCQILPKSLGVHIALFANKYGHERVINDINVTIIFYFSQTGAIKFIENEDFQRNN